jgi:two-component system, NarL family, sensor histidine kinase UhpB
MAACVDYDSGVKPFFERKDAIVVAITIVGMAGVCLAAWLTDLHPGVTAVIVTLLLVTLLESWRRAQRVHRSDTQTRDALQSEVELRTKQLASSEARFRGLFETATDAILTVDGSQRVVMANPAAARMLCLPQAELVGAPLDRFIPARSRERHHLHITGFGTSPPTSRPMSPQREVAGLRADGTEFPIEAAISHSSADGQKLFTVILRDISERKRAEIQLQQMTQAVESSHADLQRLTAQQDRVQEDERKRIARELHDDLQQKLAAILMNLSAAKSQLQKLEHPPTAVEQALASADELAAAAIESTRRIVNDLRPQLLDDLGLAEALEALCDQFARASGLSCQLHAQQDACDLAAEIPALATCLYRLAQESLNNVSKHAQATEVDIQLSIDGENWLRLEVCDNGRGLDDDARRKPGAFGLRGMQERLRPFGGTLMIQATPQGGTAVVARVPPFDPAAE